MRRKLSVLALGASLTMNVVMAGHALGETTPGGDNARLSYSFNFLATRDKHYIATPYGGIAETLQRFNRAPKNLPRKYGRITPCAVIFRLLSDSYSRSARHYDKCKPIFEFPT